MPSVFPAAGSSASSLQSGPAHAASHRQPPLGSGTPLRLQTVGGFPLAVVCTAAATAAAAARSMGIRVCSGRGGAPGRAKHAPSASKSQVLTSEKDSRLKGTQSTLETQAAAE